jgi:hypothetical protein
VQFAISTRSTQIEGVRICQLLVGGAFQKSNQ